MGRIPRWLYASIYLAVSLLLILAVGALSADASTPSKNRAKVTRAWERMMHTDLDPSQTYTKFVLDYKVKRCGRKACMVDWHTRTFRYDTPREEKGTSVCYVIKRRVRCRERSSDIYIPSSPEGSDWDADGVQNVVDACPHQPGPLRDDDFSGCPDDADGDGHLNEADGCPFLFSPNTPDGCGGTGGSSGSAAAKAAQQRSTDRATLTR